MGVAVTALDILVSAVIGGAMWCPAVDAIAGALEARYGLDGDFAEMWATAEVMAHRAARDRGEMAS